MIPGRDLEALEIFDKIIVLSFFVSNFLLNDTNKLELTTIEIKKSIVIHIHRWQEYYSPSFIAVRYACDDLAKLVYYGTFKCIAIPNQPLAKRVLLSITEEKSCMDEERIYTGRIAPGIKKFREKLAKADSKFFYLLKQPIVE